MNSTLAALCAISFIGVCFTAIIPIPEKVPKYSLSNIRGSPNIRGQPPEGPWEVPVFDHPPVFDDEDEMFEGGPTFSPPKRNNPNEYDIPDEDFNFDNNEIDHEESDTRMDELPEEKLKPFDEEEVHEKEKATPTEDIEIPTEVEDLDKDISEDDDQEHKVGPENDLGEEVPPRPGALPFDSPFFDIDQMRRYFDLVERAMDKVFRQTIEEALVLNGTFANTTEEEVDINGHQYKVLKSIVKSGDHNSTIFIEAVETTLESNRTKRSNWYSEGAQTAKDSDP